MTHQKAALYDVLAPAGPGDLLTAWPRARQMATLCDVLAPAKTPRFEEQPLSLGKSWPPEWCGSCWWWRRPWRVVFSLWAFVGGEATNARVSSLEYRARHARLADDRHQSARTQFRMIGHRHCDRAVGIGLLHHHVAAAPSHLYEPMPRENPAGLTA